MKPDDSMRFRRALSTVLFLAFAVSGLTACRYIAAPTVPTPASSGEDGTILWSGAVTPTSARVTAFVPETVAPDSLGPVTLALDTDSTFATSRVLPGTASADGRATHFALDSLEPATRYHYRLLHSGRPLSGRSGTFQTFADAPYSFDVVLGACAETGSRHPVFDAIRASDPDLFLHLGDMHYEDISTPDLGRYRDALQAVHASPEQSRLYRSVPLAYMWDDHDYGPNNSTGAAPIQETARQAYRAFVPHYPLAAGPTGPVHQAFTMGRVRFILTDLRSARSRNDAADTAAKSMMGTEQRRWFEKELERAAGRFPVVVWVSTVPWIANDPDEVDRWSGFTTERDRLARTIDSLGLASNLVIVSGDAHMVAVDDGTHNTYGPGEGIGVPVVHAAALDRTGSVKGGPYALGTYPNRFSLRGANDGQYVQMAVSDAGGDEVCVTSTGRRWEYDTQQMVDLLSWSRCFPARLLEARPEPR